jgi:hypothetical protein
MTCFIIVPGVNGFGFRGDVVPYNSQYTEVVGEVAIKEIKETKEIFVALIACV